ncbi:DNA-3-methyladenine glycosylase 2 [Comamonas sp. GB3 AK4-5]|uniref:DNA-3-methyladenine glycosylase 2 n=1 Tax=Comamonas sp. GB3 AK4-5 TaxID=3231487 RepID=UPI00351F5398
MAKKLEQNGWQPLLHVQTLPPDYRWQELLGFHQRDSEQLAEQLDQQGPQMRLRKGLDWQGQPAWLELCWEGAAAGREAPLQLHATLHLPQKPQADISADTQARWAGTVRRMLGLAYPPAALEAAHAQHPQLGRLLRAQAGLHVPAAPTAWEALTWAITGQQISVAAAVTLRRRLIRAAGQALGGVPGTESQSPLRTYPNSAQVVALGEAGLRAAGYSQSKTRALLALAVLVDSGALPIEDWACASDAGQMTAAQIDAASQQLLAVLGIGPWTVHYTLLRGLGWPDGSLHGDVAVRKALAGLLGVERVTEAQTRDWLLEFAPWRALVAAHLWASLSAKAY